VRLARSAAPQFEAELAELKGKRAQVQEKIWREELDRLSGELQGLDPELHAAAEQLESIIGKRQSLLNEQAQIAYKFDMPLAQILANESSRLGRTTMRKLFPSAWLRRREASS
jgi:chromosome segregation ATPase